MKQGSEVWKEFCSFFDKSFDEQMKLNQEQNNLLFNGWKKTKGADHFCPHGVDNFEDIPLTTYDDYPILGEFGKEVEQLNNTVPQREEDDLWDHYLRLGKKTSSVLDGWMTDDFGLCCKTSGTSGRSKWFVHGEGFVRIGLKNIMAFMAMGCSEGWGGTGLKKGLKMLNISGPTPYISNMVNKAALEYGLEVVPPLRVTEKTADMREKIMISLKLIEQGERIDIAGGIASAFHMACRYFTDRAALYRDFYQSMDFGTQKMALYMMWLHQSLFGKKYGKAKEIMPLKAMALGGFDTEIYAAYLEDQFGVEPLNVYGSTETGFVMFGTPDRKRDLMPLLNSGHFEFATENGQVKKISELEKDEIYELVYTPFHSLLVRYQMGDLFKVVHFRDGGLPVLSFESRKSDVLDFFAYFRLSESLAAKILTRAGLPPTDKWVFVKELEPDEHLSLLMEREWSLSEQEASRKIFDALLELNPFFGNYVKDFGIKDPWKIIRVTYLQKGAFMRYIMLRAKEGAELGQIKPIKLITPKNRKIAETLKRV